MRRIAESILPLFICVSSIVPNNSLAEGARGNLLAFSESEHLLPEIVNILKTLKYYPSISDTSAKSEQYFRDVTILNALFLSEQYRLEVHLLRKDFMQLGDLLRDTARPFEQSEAEVKFARDIVDKLRDLNAYLHIQSEHIGHFIEFRMFYTDNINLTTEQKDVDIRPYLFNQSTRYFGFLIDMENKDYVNDLAFCLKKNLPNSSVNPTCEVEVHGPVKTENGIYRSAVGDRILLSLKTNIHDLHHSEQKWTMLPPSKPEAVVGFKETGFSQELEFTQPGDYRIQASLSDLIHDPTDTVVMLKVHYKPEFTMPRALFSSSVFKIPFYWNSDTNKLYVSAEKLRGPRADFERPSFTDSTRLEKDLDVLFNFNVEVPDTGRIVVSSLSLPGTYELSITGSDGYVYSEPQRISLKVVPKRRMQIIPFLSNRVLSSTEPKQARDFWVGGLIIGHYLFDEIPIVWLPSGVSDIGGLIFLSIGLPLTHGPNPHRMIRFPFYFYGVETELAAPVWIYYKKTKEYKTTILGVGIETTFWYRRILFYSVGLSLGYYRHWFEKHTTCLTSKFGVDLPNLYKTISPFAK